MTLALLDLPSELLLLVVSYLSTPGFRAALARTCHRLRDVTERTLYSDVVIWSEAKYNAYFKAVMVHRERLAWAKRYEIRFHFATDAAEPSLALWMSTYMPNLESLSIRLPQVDDVELSFSRRRYVVLDIQRFFQEQVWTMMNGNSESNRSQGRSQYPSLKSCELEFDRTTHRAFLPKLPAIDAVFRHPTLTHLSIKHFKFSLEDRVPVTFPKSNCIQDLELISCDFVCSTLAEMLQTHFALRRLSLRATHSMWNGWSDTPPYEPRPGAARWADVVRAISFAGRARTLEHLELTSSNNGTISESLQIPLDFSEFTVLQTLRLDGTTTMFPQLFRETCSTHAELLNGGEEVFAVEYRKGTETKLSCRDESWLQEGEKLAAILSSTTIQT